MPTPSQIPKTTTAPKGAHATRTLFVENKAMVREAIVFLLNNRPEPVTCALSCCSSEALAACSSTPPPDVVLIDITHPDGDGNLEIAKRIRALLPTVRIIAIADIPCAKTMADASSVGISGFVSKNSGADELASAISMAAMGRRSFSSDVIDSLASSGIPWRDRRRKARDKTRLSMREQTVATLIAEGLQSSEIAKKLNISEHTANVHRRNLMKKLGIHNSIELTKHAIRLGWISV